MAFIGIDFGSKFSCVAISRDARLEIILNDHGNRFTPSYIGFSNSGRLVGEEARAREFCDNAAVVSDVKRLLGRRYVDLNRITDRTPFDVCNQDGEPRIVMKSGGRVRRLAPEELVGMIINSLRLQAELYLGSKVDGAVVTVPAHASDLQRRATLRAAKLGGIRVLKLLNAPTAAALARCFLHPPTKDKRILVYDIGGETLDVTILTVDTRSNYTVHATAFARFGADDFDERLTSYLCDLFKDKTGLCLEGDVRAYKRLRTAAERAKRTLSYATDADIEIESLVSGLGLRIKVTRAQFESAAADLFARTLEPVRKVLTDSKLAPNSVDEVILVGGGTRVPGIRNCLREYFGPSKVDLTLDPDEPVVCGAAALAGGFAANIKDICPRAFSIASKGGIAAVLIPRLSIIPTRRLRTFTTTDIDSVALKVLEGDMPRVANNHLIGEFEMKDLETNRIHLTFSLDGDGILKVTATDKHNRNIPLLHRGGSEEREKRMFFAVQHYQDEDEELKSRAETRNQLEANALSTLGSLKEELAAGKITCEEANEIEKRVDNTLKWLKERGAIAQSDELLEYQIELLQASAPLFRARMILSPTVCGPTSVIFPLTSGPPISQMTAVNRLLAIGSLAEEPVPGPSATAASQYLGSADVIRDILGVDLDLDDMEEVDNFCGDFVDSDELLDEMNGDADLVEYLNGISDEVA